MNSQAVDIVKILLESNLFNFLVVAGLILYFLPKSIKALVIEKRSEINSKISQYEEIKEKHVDKLAELEEKLMSLNSEADRILDDAEKAAVSVRKEIINSAHQEIEKMKEIAFKEIESHKKRAYDQVKEKFINLASDAVEGVFLDKIQSGENPKHIEAFKSLDPIYKN